MRRARWFDKYPDPLKTENVSVNHERDLALLFTVHGAINMHFILIQLYFVLNARSRMNYNHLEGKEG